MQLPLIIIASLLGLTYGHYNYGFIFDSNICLFAGLTLIMPTLFNVKLSDLQLVFQYKKLIIKNLFLNYFIIPSIALIIGVLTNNFGIAAGLFLLSVLSGGGMVMHWIKTSNGDTSLGFIIFFINIIFISLSLLMLHTFGIYAAEYFEEAYSAERNISNFAKQVIILLVIIPFVASRIILFIKPIQNFIEGKQVYISRLSLFLIVFYLFGLQTSQLLFEIYSFEPELLYISFAAVLVFYACVLLVSKFIYKLDSAQEKAAFWHSITRYITLALVISTFSSNTFGVSMILPIMFAYIVQIPLAIQASKYLVTHKEIN